MTDFYSECVKHYVSVDCVIFALHEGKLRLLLIRRDYEPMKGQWSLIGGFVEATESIESSAQRVLKNLTGLEDVYMMQVGAFGAVDRDPVARVISIAYAALLNFSDIDNKIMSDYDAHWFDVNELPPIIRDHKAIVDRALSEIRKNFRTSSMPYALLPGLFTLTQLQKLYENVLGMEIDKRNFRRRILEDNYVQPTEKIDKLSSRRGARLYKYVGEIKSV